MIDVLDKEIEKSASNVFLSKELEESIDIDKDYNNLEYVVCLEKKEVYCKLESFNKKRKKICIDLQIKEENVSDIISSKILCIRLKDFKLSTKKYHISYKIKKYNLNDYILRIKLVVDKKRSKK